MLTTYELKMPGAVYSGEDALGRIPGILAANGVKRLAVFTDRGIEGAGLLELPMAGVREAGAEAVILDAAMIRKLPRKIAAATGWTPCPTPLNASPAARPTPSAIFSPSRPWT